MTEMAEEDGSGRVYHYPKQYDFTMDQFSCGDEVYKIYR